MQIIKKTKKSVCFITDRGNEYHFKCKFPKKNPDGSLEFITNALAHLGVFKGIIYTQKQKISRRKKEI